MTIQLVPIGLMTHPCTTLSLLVSSLHTAWEGSDLSVVSIIYTVADLYTAQHIELITVLMKVYGLKQFAVLSKTAPQNVIHSGWCKCVQILLHHVNIKQLRVYYYLELMHTRQSFNYSIETRTSHPQLRLRVRVCFWDCFSSWSQMYLIPFQNNHGKHMHNWYYRNIYLVCTVD